MTQSSHPLNTARTFGNGITSLPYEVGLATHCYSAHSLPGGCAMERLSPLSMSLHANANNASSVIICQSWGMAPASGASSFCGSSKHTQQVMLLRSQEVLHRSNKAVNK